MTANTEEAPPYTTSGPSGLDLILEESRRLGAIKSGDLSTLNDVTLEKLEERGDKRALAQKVTQLPSYKLLSKNLSAYSDFKLEQFAMLLDGLNRYANQGHLGLPPGSSITVSSHHVYNPVEAHKCMYALRCAGPLLQEAYNKRDHLASRLHVSRDALDTAFKELAAKMTMLSNHLEQPQVCRSPW